MKLHSFTILLALSVSRSTTSAKAKKLEACPLLWKQYTSATSIASELKFQNATKTLNAALEGLIKRAPYKDTTFSIGIFSAFDEGLLYQYSHTGPAVANSSYGTNKVDVDSIYRIGSNSKLLTVYLFLLHESDVRWSDSVSKYLPELVQDKGTSWNSITPDWNAVTVGDLAAHMGGLDRACGFTLNTPLFCSQVLKGVGRSKISCCNEKSSHKNLCTAMSTFKEAEYESEHDSITLINILTEEREQF